MCLKVYIAGDEDCGRTSSFVSLLQKEGCAVSFFDWRSGPSLDDRSAFAAREVKAIQVSDVFWLIVPQAIKAPWWLFGVAVGAGKLTVVSGDLAASLVTASAHRQCLTNVEALHAILDLARRPRPEGRQETLHEGFRSLYGGSITKIPRGEGTREAYTPTSPDDDFPTGGV